MGHERKDRLSLRIRRAFYFVILSATIMGCVKLDMSSHRSPSSTRTHTAKNIDQWIVGWLNQAPAMSAYVTLSRVEHRTCAAAQR